MKVSRLSRTAALLAAALASTPVLAQEAPVEDNGAIISAAVTAGTLGIGPEVGVRFSDHVGIRASASFLSFGADFDSDENTYRGGLHLKSYGAMIDVHPFGGAFRLSAGARINRNRVDVRLQPGASTTIEIGDNVYTAAQVGTLTGGADVKKFAPALTLGWGGSKRKGFFFATEAGVLFQGSARLREFRATGTAQADSGFRAALERERVELQDDIDKVKVYPILQFGIGFRF
ncbi:hypothetical protein [Sphingomonas sp. RS2018]